MKLKRSSILLLFVTNLIFAQAYNQPESVVYDAVNDRYLVTNKADGNIISVPRLDPNNLGVFANAVGSSLRGITIIDNTVWCAGTDGDMVRQYLYARDLNTGNYVKAILITSGVFVNDVVAGESGFIYVSDGNNNKIYKVNINDGSYSDLNFGGSNGLLFDEANNRLIYTDDTPINSSQISAIDLATNTSTVLTTNPNFQGLDGLTIDHLGNYYVSSWSGGYFLRPS